MALQLTTDNQKEHAVPGSSLERFCHYIWYDVLMAIWIFVLVFFTEIGSIQNFDYNALPKCSEQAVVLTGGTRGIGRKVLQKLLQLDYFVIFDGLKAVDEIRSEGVQTGRAKCLALNLKSLKSVLKFATNVLHETSRIDLLINNAGVMFEPYNLTENGYEVHFQVNYLSHFLLTQLLLPRMKSTASLKSTNCRVVNVSSIGHHAASASDIDDIPNPRVYSTFRGYADSKLSQILFTKYLDAKLKSEGANVNVYAVHPGIIITDLYFNMPFLQIFRSVMKTFFRSADTGAEVVMHAAISPELEGQGGLYIVNKEMRKPSRIAEDVYAQAKLWETSNRCVKENPLINIAHVQ